MKAWTVVGCVLACVPITALVVQSAGVLRASGGHGLGAWMLDSACFFVLGLSTIVNGALASKGKRAPLILASLSVAAMIVFVARFGLPFRS